MDNPLMILILLTMAAVVVVLVMGLGGFAGGGKFNKDYGNKLMRLRILAQFIAVVLIVVLVYFTRNGG